MEYMKRTLVLAGGGTKGIYECGVIKALKELGKDQFDCIIGVSVGALNATLLVQNQFERLENMYENIASDQFVNGFLPSDMNVSTLISQRQEIQEQISRYLKEKSLDITPFYHMVDAYFDEKKFFSSMVDFGCVCARKKDHSGLFVTKDMMKGRGKDWLIASASAYPAFPVKEVDGEEYIDGGYYDNFPIDYALRYGSDEIVGIELGENPLHPMYENKSSITIIRPHAPLYSFLDFDVFKMYRAKLLGYNDTMKKYGRYAGERYTFLPFDLPSYTDEYVRSLMILETTLKNANMVNDRLFSESVIADRLKEMTCRDFIDEKTYFFGMLDAVMELCEFDESQVYDYGEVERIICALFEDASRADYRFMDNFRPMELIDLIRSLDHKMMVRLLVHRHFYPDRIIIPEKLIMTVTPFDIAQAELIARMIRQVKEGKYESRKI